MHQPKIKPKLYANYIA